MRKNDKSEDIYERLANALEAIPHGFPRTESGVELRLIKMAFTPEEVSLAGHLSRFPETAAEISKRAGLDVADATEILDALLPRRLVKTAGAPMHGAEISLEGEKKYRLGPFFVGWYEANMRLLGKEFAELYEQYATEGGGERILSPRPGSLGVVPVRGSLTPEQMEVMEPHLDIDAHFARHERFLVLECVCTREQELLGNECKMSTKRCGFLGFPPEAPLSDTVLDREAADKLMRELEEEGLVHLAAYGFVMSSETPQFVGCCHCCNCCCSIIHQGNRLGLKEAAQRSNYRAVIDREECNACGVCIKRCPVYAIDEDEDGKSKVEREKCIGCGVCVIKCPTDALKMETVSEEEWFHTPSSMEEWEETRLGYMESMK